MILNLERGLTIGYNKRAVATLTDLNEPLTLPVADFDQILLLDVIEHLRDPEAFLEGLWNRLGAHRAEVLLTTPNVAFLGTRIMLLLGQFNYGETGILDRTHTRLFTLGSLKDLVTESGFEISEVVGIPAPFPKVIPHRKLAHALLRFHQLLIGVAPRLFAYQILVVAKNRQHPRHVLVQTRASAYVEAA